MNSTPIQKVVNLTDLHYIATPYTNYPDGPEAAWAEAARVTGQLLSLSILSYCPIAHGHSVSMHTDGGLNQFNHEFWMWVDKPMMEACDALIVVEMESVQQSRGVNEEISRFVTMQKPVYTLDPVKMMGEVMYTPPNVKHRPYGLQQGAVESGV